MASGSGLPSTGLKPEVYDLLLPRSLTLDSQKVLADKSRESLAIEARYTNFDFDWV